jgi:uncharacterized protein YutE (UPF0331/DUF86 family)
MEIYTRKLDLIEDSLKKLYSIRKENLTLYQFKTSWKNKDSAERNIQKIVEAVIDIGKMLIAEKRLREPASNREVFEILEENHIFPPEFIPLIDKMIGMRNIIVHGYNRIDESIVFGVLKKNLADIKKLSTILKKICLIKK